MLRKVLTSKKKSRNLQIITTNSSKAFFNRFFFGVEIINVAMVPVMVVLVDRFADKRVTHKHVDL